MTQTPCITTPFGKPIEEQSFAPVRVLVVGELVFADNGPVPHETDPVATAGGIQFMGYHNHGPALAVNLPKQIQHVPGGCGIEITRGFIGQYESRLVDQGSGHRTTLLFAARNL